MRARYAVAIAVIFLFCISSARVVSGEQTTWVSQSEAYAYAYNLLGWYDTYSPSGAGFLYHTGDQSFSVLVMRAYPNSDNLTSFWFSEIQGNGPEVSIDQNDSTLAALQIAETDNGLIVAHSIVINHTILPATLVWTTLTSKVLANGQLDSQEAAKYLAQQAEENNVPPPQPPGYGRITWSDVAGLWNTFWPVVVVFATIFGIYGTWLYVRDRRSGSKNQNR